MSVCKGCGKEMKWGLTSGGVRVPLDARAPVYSIGDYDEATNTYPIARLENAHVTHFSTCPKASSFSRTRKQDGSGPPRPADAAGSK